MLELKFKDSRRKLREQNKTKPNSLEARDGFI